MEPSGIAYTLVIKGWRSGLVSAGGLLAPPLVGSLLLVLGRRMPKALLLGLSAAMALSLLLWVRTLVGFGTVSALLLLIASVARFGSDGLRLFFVQLLGLLLAMDFVARIDYLFVQSGQAGGRLSQSDVAGVASSLGGPYWFWGGLIAGLSALLLGIGLLSVLRSSSPVRALPKV